jgi:hypothetical protein
MINYFWYDFYKECKNCFTNLDLPTAGIGSYPKVEEESKFNFDTILSCTTLNSGLEKHHNLVTPL